MPLAAVALVLVSAISHAYWNLLAKQAHDKLVFTWLIYFTGGFVMLPLAIWGLLTEPVDPRMWLCTLGTSLSFCVYGVSLARAYGRGDMSIVYPLVRGTGPVMTVLFAHLFLGERLNLFGYMGILFIVSGAVGLTWPRYDPHSEVDRATFRRRQLAVLAPALVTGTMIAVFSVIDKVGVTLASPLFYNCTTFWGTAFMLAPLVLHRRSSTAVLKVWRTSQRALWMIGALNVLGYLLVLYAFRLAPASYVIALRSTSVLFAVALGTHVLREGCGWQRVALGALIVVGLGLVSVAG
ncbi:MAG: EamA family transporter [candidate division WS1 bacterium]|nr:EamA family transporter [candidate division WS1 bacterium]